MATPTRVYWDASTWIAVINEERKIGLPDGTNENRFLDCTSIIKRAISGEIEILTSAFTLAEVCKSNEAKTANKSKLSSFFDHKYILVVPVDTYVGLQAQTMQASKIVNLKPPDAVHLASAQKSNVSEFHTFDSDFLKLDGRIEADNGLIIKICKPGEGEGIGGLFADQEKEQK